MENKSNQDKSKRKRGKTDRQTERQTAAPTPRPPLVKRKRIVVVRNTGDLANSHHVTKHLKAHNRVATPPNST